MFFYWLFYLLSTFSQAMTIAIDPGHGGTDHGATRYNVQESAVVLGVSQHLEKILNADAQFKAFLTRQDQSQMELHHRVKKAQTQNADLFVSIHANSSPDPQSQGMEIYFRNELAPDEDSRRLASEENKSEMIKRKKIRGDVQNILHDMQRSLNTVKSYELSWHVVDQWKVPFSKVRNETIKQGPFYVIHQEGIPSVLIEIGFITNSKEAKRLNTSSYQKEIAQTIYTGLKDFQQTLTEKQSKAF